MNKILLALQTACADPGAYTPRLGPDADHRDRDYEPHPSWHARAVAIALEQIAIDHFEVTILDKPPRKYLAQQFPAIQGHLPVDEWVSRMLLLAAAGWQIELMIGDMLEAFAVPKQKATGGGPREMRVPERVEWLGFKAQRLEKAYTEACARVADLEAQLKGAWQNRDHFCKAINDIAPLVGMNVESASPEAVVRNTKLAIDKLEAIRAEVDNLVDGAEDAGPTARLANAIACILEGQNPVASSPEAQSIMVAVVGDVMTEEQLQIVGVPCKPELSSARGKFPPNAGAAQIKGDHDIGTNPSGDFGDGRGLYD